MPLTARPGPVIIRGVGQPDSIPSGAVTLLFTDIQGSTRLWESEPDQMAPALRRHDVILRETIQDNGGYVFKTVGDAFCASFWTAEAAVAAAAEAQRILTAESWTTSRPILVRMGLHTGVCEERDGDYFGPVVNRAARLEAVAHGGQILVSGATAELTAQNLTGAVTLRDLGLHRLKDLGRPEQVFQLEAPFLPADFPPLTSLDNPELPNNLPSVVNAFVGREQELAEVRSLVASSRLVTLTGAGGSGKTRLALQAAAELLDKTADGVWFIELAPVTDTDKIPAVVAAVLSLPDQSGGDLTSIVADAIGNQDALLVLDNCEHVIGAAAKFCEYLIRHCPKVALLATSREPLGINGERVYRVPSMSLPPADAETEQDVASSDAVLLFAERARLHDPGFALNARSAPLVATLCRRLDGVPLALELAAARLSSMSLAQVTERLDQRFRLLTGGSRNAMPRQQTLQATVDWSFGLLNPSERQTLIRLSVFAGGFDLPGAEAVCTSEDVDSLDVLDLVGSLVDKSLIVAEHAGGSVRYRLLETIRQYSAQELLRSAGEAEVLQLRDCHAEYYLGLAQTARPSLSGHGQARWLHRLDAEWDNLRAVFAHLRDERRPADVLRLAVALQRFATSRGHPDFLVMVQWAMTQPGIGLSALLVESLITLSALIGVFERKDAAQLKVAKMHAERALALARELGDIRLEARALGQLAGASGHENDLPAVRRLASEGAGIASKIGDMQLLGELLASFAGAAPTPEDVRKIRLEVLACCRRSGDDFIAAGELHSLYGLDLHAGLIENAEAYLRQSISLAEQLGGELFLYFLRSDFGLLLLIQGKHAEAVPVVRRCLLVARRIGMRIDASEVILGAACTTAFQGDHVRAARLHGAADVDLSAARQIRAINWSRAEQDLREREQRQLREELGAAAYEDAYLAGSKLTPAQAVELALSRDAAPA
jgi:predicted ATPase/class 3 adenylate cyclase